MVRKMVIAERIAEEESRENAGEVYSRVKQTSTAVSRAEMAESDVVAAEWQAEKEEAGRGGNEVK